MNIVGRSDGTERSIGLYIKFVNLLYGFDFESKSTISRNRFMVCLC